MALLELPYPIHAADAHDGIIPSKYVSIKRTQACMCCNLIHEYCEIYAYTEMRSTLGYQRVENLRRIDWVKYRIPIEQWEDKKTVLLPFCHACNEPSLHQCLMERHQLLDPPPPVKLVLNNAAHDTEAQIKARGKTAAGFGGKVEVRTVKPSSGTSSKAKPKLSVDDLMDMIK